MSEVWLHVLLLAGLFLALFAMAEWLYQKQQVPAEHTRKLVHAGTGLLTLLFPLWLQYWWQAALLCSSFLILLFVSKRMNFLKSIHAVKRQTHGSVLYPVIVALVFLFYVYATNYFQSFQPRYYFYLPVLTMAVSDPAAALAGRWYQQKKGFRSGKTAAGSITFFLTALMLAVLFISLFKLKEISLPQTLLLASGVSAAATGVEYFSNRGWDNFFIPLAVIIIQMVFEVV